MSALLASLPVPLPVPQVVVVVGVSVSPDVQVLAPTLTKILFVSTRHVLLLSLG